MSSIFYKLHTWYNKNDKYMDVVYNGLNDDDIENLELIKEKDDLKQHYI